ncbi:PAAR domain-containing protein [Frischella sp. Ac48]|uniref:PAAR domain-containing protein n=1 Tax=Frischella japonica TaxID=2741544 RepID=A0ABR7QZ80_9GAMM|nr:MULTISPECIES: PAAR domain-containing protein [Frischella]MBC9131507.1 PAAR domain-containing protein [Frischella japonica]MBX4133961.1 PAAR domain-containing protein [Frischella sp. Ac48]
MGILRCVIRLGDATNHGGKVISASSTTVIRGKPVARVGDMVSCPKKGHGITPIIEGESTFKDQGKPVALDGHHAGCGCVLISSLSDVGKG